MIRIGTFIWLAVLTLIGVGLYQVELGVLDKEAELRQIKRQIQADREATHVLEAEWSYLNDPTRLADLARRYTDLAPVTPTQIADYSRLLPRRPDVPPFNRGEHEGGTADLAPLLSSMEPPAKPATAAPAVAAAAASTDDDPIAGALEPAVQTRKTTRPADEQAEADGVIDAILADMKKAQQ
jgi:hypothetical protein